MGCEHPTESITTRQIRTGNEVITRRICHLCGTTLSSQEEDADRAAKAETEAMFSPKSNPRLDEIYGGITDEYVDKWMKQPNIRDRLKRELRDAIYDKELEDAEKAKQLAAVAEQQKFYDSWAGAEIIAIKKTHGSHYYEDSDEYQIVTDKGILKVEGWLSKE